MFAANSQHESDTDWSIFGGSNAVRATTQYVIADKPPSTATAPLFMCFIFPPFDWENDLGSSQKH